jgi:hypothetical protein
MKALASLFAEAFAKVKGENFSEGRVVSLWFKSQRPAARGSIIMKICESVAVLSLDLGVSSYRKNSQYNLTIVCFKNIHG